MYYHKPYSLVPLVSFMEERKGELGRMMRGFYIGILERGMRVPHPSGHE
jgi:hypothetical protein